MSFPCIIYFVSRVYQKIQSGKFSDINYVERKQPRKCGCIIENKLVFDVFIEALSFTYSYFRFENVLKKGVYALILNWCNNDMSVSSGLIRLWWGVRVELWLDIWLQVTRYFLFTVKKSRLPGNSEIWSSLRPSYKSK